MLIVAMSGRSSGARRRALRDALVTFCWEGSTGVIAAS
jgi:hypothetical protein